MTGPDTTGDPGPADVAKALRDGVPPSSLVDEAAVPEQPEDTQAPATTGEAGGLTVRTDDRSLAAARDRALAGPELTDEPLARLAEKDPTLWGPEASSLASVRLGWVDAAQAGEELLTELMPLVQQLHDEGLDRVLVLAPDGSAAGIRALCSSADTEVIVLDGLDPVGTAGALVELDRTVVVACSRTGADLTDPLSVVQRAFARDGLTLADRLVLVGTPDGPPARASFPGDPHTERAFSVLTAAGLVPAALAGIDVVAVLDQAQALRETMGQPGPLLQLGALLGGAAVSGRDKVVLVEPAGGALGPWVGQLLGDVTIGGDKRLVVVQVEGADAPGTEPAADTQLITLGAESAGAGSSVAGTVGAQLLGWQVAAVLAAKILGSDPFARPATPGEQLDPAEPVLTDGPVEVRGPLAAGSGSVSEAVGRLLSSVPDRGYLAIMAHLDPVSDHRASRLRALLASRVAHPVRFGWGKGAIAPGGAFLQVTGDTAGGDATLVAAQAAAAGRERFAVGEQPLLHLHLTDRASGVDTLLEAVRG